MIISFLISLAVFVAIGVSTVLKSRNTKDDYYLASHSIPPALVGLSAVATNNSGYMFIGAIGYTFATGLSSIWLMVGWILGDFIASMYVHSRLRIAAEETGEMSYAGVVASWAKGNYLPVQRVMAVISLIFLVAYASAQFVAGSKALHVLFEWPIWSGAVISAFLVMIYCMAGGIRASIWTDAAQSVVMIISMAVLLITAVTASGGLVKSVEAMGQYENFLNLFPDDLPFPGLIGGVLFIVGWLFAGLSVAGQPHVMVRFMTLDKSENILRARIWYYIWFISFYCMAIGVGMMSKIFLSSGGDFDAELALPTMAMELLHPMFVGVVLAGIFAATMSTADSLVLSCSAAITHDLLPHNIENPRLLKIITILITFAALGWALVNSQSVFNLVIMAWSGLASAFVPLLFALCIGLRPDTATSISAIIFGLLVALLWRWLGWHVYIYEGLPGIVSGVVLILAALKLQNRLYLGNR